MTTHRFHNNTYEATPGDEGEVNIAASEYPFVIDAIDGNLIVGYDVKVGINADDHSFWAEAIQGERFNITAALPPMVTLKEVSEAISMTNGARDEDDNLIPVKLWT